MLYVELQKRFEMRAVFALPNSVKEQRDYLMQRIDITTFLQHIHYKQQRD